MKDLAKLGSILLLALFAVGTVAGAAGAKPPAREPKVIELEEMVIEGKVAKPTVFYVLGRSSIRYESLKLDQSFVDRIVATARQNPF